MDPNTDTGKGGRDGPDGWRGEQRRSREEREERSAKKEKCLEAADELKEVFSSRVVVRSLGPGGQLKPANGGNRRLWEA